MEQQPPQQQTQIDPDGLQSFFTEHGRLAFLVHQHQALSAKRARMDEVAQSLLENHGEGKCAPVDPLTPVERATLEALAPAAGEPGG